MMAVVAIIVLAGVVYKVYTNEKIAKMSFIERQKQMKVNENNRDLLKEILPHPLMIIGSEKKEILFHNKAAETHFAEDAEEHQLKKCLLESLKKVIIESLASKVDRKKEYTNKKSNIE
ncbi:hypothetical protein MIDIC_490041 [Alphaproteobacteria bacterium]